MKFTHTSTLFAKLEGERGLGQKHIINIGKHSRAHIHLYSVLPEKKATINKNILCVEPKMLNI